MSMDLIAWKTPAVDNEDDAIALMERYQAGGDESLFAPSDDVLRFYDELMARYPALDRQSTPAEDPWADAPDRSDRILEMSLRWSVPDETLDAIVELARKYNLVLYDPQGPALHSPEPPAAPDDTGAQMWQAAKGGLAGVALMVAGWWVPYRLIGWPMLVIGGFLVAMALYTFAVLLKPEWQPR